MVKFLRGTVFVGGFLIVALTGLFLVGFFVAELRSLTPQDRTDGAKAYAQAQAIVARERAAEAKHH